MKQNIAVVGCGYWGKNLVRNFSELGALAAVCDPNEELAKTYADQYLVEKLSFEEIVNNHRIDGVVLAVPAPLHASMAVAAMKKGKSVFVEKPIAMDEIEARAMVDVASENNVQLMVGHLLQYHPVFIALKDIKESGELGSLKYLYSNRLSFGKVRSEEDVVWSFAPHDISMVLALVGQQPKLVKAEKTAILQGDIADTATLHMEFASGLKAHISVSWLHPYKEQKLVAIGDCGTAVFDDTKPWPEKLALYRHGIKMNGSLSTLTRSDVEYIDVPQSEPLKNECKHFIEVVGGRVVPLTSGSEGLRVLSVLTAV